LQAIFPQAHLDLLKGALQFSYDQNIKPNKTKQNSQKIAIKKKRLLKLQK
jgi:hypothetical protein